MPRQPRSAALALAAVLGLVASACGDNGDETAGSTTTSAPVSTTSPRPTCSAEQEEILDPNSSRHVFPGAAEPTYTTDPPTSGPHQLGQHPTGVFDAPIPRPIQVAMLEGGGVLIQFKDPALRDALAPLAGEGVTVAPNPTLSADVVATAWLRKRTCSGAATTDLQEFISAHAGKPAGTH